MTCKTKAFEHPLVADCSKATQPHYLKVELEPVLFL